VLHPLHASRTVAASLPHCINATSLEALPVARCREEEPRLQLHRFATNSSTHSSRATFGTLWEYRWQLHLAHGCS